MRQTKEPMTPLEEVDEILESVEAIPREKTFILRNPVSFNKLSASEVHLRAPRVGEMKQARQKKDDLDIVSKLIEVISGLNPALVDQFDYDQFQEMSDYLMSLANS